MEIRTVGEFSVRLKNALLFTGVFTIRDLANIPDKVLKSTPGIGKKSSIIIKTVLEKHYKQSK